MKLHSLSPILHADDRLAHMYARTKDLNELKEYMNSLKEIDAWSFSYDYQQSCELSVRNGKRENSSYETHSDLGLRVFIGHQSAVAHVSGDLLVTWKKAAHQAIALAHKAQPDFFHALPPERYFQRSAHDVCIESLESSDLNSWMDRVHEIENYALGRMKGTALQSDGASVSGSYHLSVRANSHGLWAVTPSTFFNQGLSLLLRDSQGDESDGDAHYHRVFSHLGSTQSLYHRTADRILSQRDKKSVPSGIYPVIFTERSSFSLIKHLLAALSGRLQYLGQTFLHNEMHSQVLPKWCTIADQPHIDYGPGSQKLDSDGIATQPLDIIQNGCIQEYILGYYSAVRLGLEPNGTAGGLRNVFMSTNCDSLEEMIAQYDRCIVVDSISGPGVNIEQGTYSRGIQGWYYESGQRQHALKDTTIAAQLRELYLSLQWHAAPKEPWSSWKIGPLGFAAINVSSD